MMRLISAYSAIRLLPRCLVVFDIDDTVLHFPSHNRAWWKDTKQTYQISHHLDEHAADQQTMYDWRAAVSALEAHPIDKDGFHTFYNQARNEQCDIIFLTARDPCMKEATYKHMRTSLLDVHDDQIYFSDQKGPALRNILDTQFPHHQHVIFVDDYEKNHQSVLSTFAQDPKITLDVYHFVHSHS